MLVDHHTTMKCNVFQLNMMEYEALLQVAFWYTATWRVKFESDWHGRSLFFFIFQPQIKNYYNKNVEIMTKYDMSELLVSKIKVSKFGFS